MAAILKDPILVLGDINLDTVILPCWEAHEADGDTRYGWHEGPRYTMSRKPGGAWLLGRVIRAALDLKKSDPNYENVVRLGIYSEPENDPDLLDSLAILEPFRIGPGAQERVYRLPDQGTLGSIRSSPRTRAERRDDLKNKLLEYLDKITHDHRNRIGTPWLIVVPDLHGIFRDIEPVRSIQPFLEGNDHFNRRSKNDGLILWRMSYPLGKGKTWDYIFEHYRDNLIVVTNTDYLRRGRRDPGRDFDRGEGRLSSQEP